VTVLQIDKIKAYYKINAYGNQRTVKAVDNVSLEIEEDETFGIAGESSCGKSTLIRVISGTIKPPLTIIEGKVIYNFGDESIYIGKVNGQEEIGKVTWEKVSYIPQSSMSVLNPVMKVRDIFYDLLKSHKKTMEKEVFNETIKEHLNSLGLPIEVLDLYPHQLSGGMRQRVIIALATIFRPKVILADEPTSALDVVVQQSVLQLLREIQNENKNTLILVSHDMSILANIANRIGIMYAGKIVEVAKVKDIFENPMHPYTKFLINSIPRIGDKSDRLSIPGFPPSLADPPNGCRFHPRCPYVMDICKEKSPLLCEVAEGHNVACFLTSEESEDGKY